ncbi:helix-turn-helix domain-containing protein [Streptomyces sp. CA-179760]|uniref:helix-turn-helix domain-containing protein n=1 Tax=Streptomyces sp. CA-179760 TaxID=3240054 RepID=UPI003D915A13
MASEQSGGAGGGTELGQFLRARRTQTLPGQVGLTVGPGLRRTPGLRREEPATLAGMSIDYYVRLERGKETRPSPAVLDAPGPPGTPPSPRRRPAGPCART